MRKFLIAGYAGVLIVVMWMVYPYVVGDDAEQEARALGADGIYATMTPPQQQVRCGDTRVGKLVTACRRPDGWVAIRDRNIVEVHHYPDGDDIVIVDFTK